MLEEEKLRKEHYLAIETNRNNHAEMDQILALIHEYEQLNKELVDELEIYMDQDEQARAILNRKERMRTIIETSLRKIAVSSEPIKHLKYWHMYNFHFLHLLFCLSLWMKLYHSLIKDLSIYLNVFIEKKSQDSVF